MEVDFDPSSSEDEDEEDTPKTPDTPSTRDTSDTSGTPDNVEQHHDAHTTGAESGDGGVLDDEWGDVSAFVEDFDPTLF